MARLGKREAELLAFGRKEAVRNLDQDAAAVAQRRVRADRAAMVEIDQNLKTLFEDRMRLAVLHVGDEADAAGIMLLRRIVETLGARSQRINAREMAPEGFLRGGFGSRVHLSAPGAVAFLEATVVPIL